MGQYHTVINLSKKQTLDPHKFGDGLKLREFGCSAMGTMTALAYLLGCSTGRGGGDFARGKLAGSWAGDRITILGDYAEAGDMRESSEDISRECDATKAGGEGYADISDAVLADCPQIRHH